MLSIIGLLLVLLFIYSRIYIMYKVAKMKYGEDCGYDRVLKIGLSDLYKARLSRFDRAV